jgi:hypothetical protein
MRRPPRSRADETAGRDRGQLILVGAVTIALTLIGLVVVFNTVLFTDTKTPTEPLESGAEAQDFNRQVDRDVREIMQRVDPIATDDDDFEEWVTENVTDYSDLVAASRADTGPVYVRVSTEAGNVSRSGDQLRTTLYVVYETQSVEYQNTRTVVAQDP